MKSRRTVGLILAVGLALWGCTGASSPARLVWTANPVVAEAENEAFKAAIEPRKGEFPYFTHFHLTLENKSDADMVVDWNATQYLFDGRPQGVMVFKGIDPKAVGTASVPPDTVAPGSVFARDVMPLRLIAWSPVREKTMDEHSITPGMFPAGTNGIRLAVGQSGSRLIIPLSVRISSAGAP